MRDVHTSFFFSSRRRHTRFDCDWSSDVCSSDLDVVTAVMQIVAGAPDRAQRSVARDHAGQRDRLLGLEAGSCFAHDSLRSEEHTSELQSQSNLVCRLLLEKKKDIT